MLAARGNGNPALVIPPPPAGWKPANPGVTKGHGPMPTTTRLLLRRLGYALAIIAAGKLALYLVSW